MLLFRSFSGFKAQCGYLTLVVVAEFNEWKVLVHGPGVAIMGARQFDQAKAKAHAEAIAESYLREFRKQDVSAAGLVWVPTDHDDWLVFSGTVATPSADAAR
jgi:hypothetical protein